MKLPNFFRFLKQEEQNTSTIPATLKDFYKIPRASEIKDPHLKQLIVSYQKSYRQTLHSKKNLTSLDFDLNSITDKMKMYINLLLNIFLEDKSSLYKTSNEKFSLSDALKMQIYLSDINELYLDSLCRLIALNEIAQKFKFLISKKN